MGQIFTQFDEEDSKDTSGLMVIMPYSVLQVQFYKYLENLVVQYLENLVVHSNFRAF